MSTFVHMELNTSDPEAAREFYRDVFGWEYQDVQMPEGVYTMVASNGTPIGGFQKNPMPDAPSHWLGYVGVDSLERALNAAVTGGATVLVPTTTVPGMGSLAILTDPTGAVFAIWEAEASEPEAAADDGGAEQEAAEAAPATQAPKKAAKKKATKKKAAAKKAPKKAAKKKAAAKKAPKKAAKKKAAAKKAPKKAAKKKAAAKKAPKKAGKKKAGKKKAGKKKG